MYTEFKAKFIQHLAQRNHAEGFTIIELLVVVIILGILAAMALPNYLSQAGKARETELKSTVGTVNRAQQAFHFERQQWGNLSDLGVTVSQQYQETPGITTPGGDAVVVTNATSAASNGTRAYGGRVRFAADGQYIMGICGTTSVSTSGPIPSGYAADGTVICPADSTIIR